MTTTNNTVAPLDLALELASVRDCVRWAATSIEGGTPNIGYALHQQANRVDAMLSELRTLRARNAELVAVVEEVARRMARHGSGDVLFHSQVRAALAKQEGRAEG
jgi:hypothetical protein